MCLIWTEFNMGSEFSDALNRNFSCFPPKGCIIFKTVNIIIVSRNSVPLEYLFHYDLLFVHFVTTLFTVILVTVHLSPTSFQVSLIWLNCCVEKAVL